jgi:peptidoglycan/xylan/chitin deacetylase (PgdA/CDA1 family)
MILMLHRVIEDACEYSYPNITRLHVTVRHLEDLLVQFRARGYEIISLDDLHSRLESGMAKSKFVAFTFDDAYRDCYELAFPVFKKHAAPFALYVPTAVPDQEMFWWHYMLDDLVFRSGEAIEVCMGGENRRFVLGTLPQKCQTYAAIEAHINGIAGPRRREILDAIFEPYGLDPRNYAEKLSMTWAQIRDLDRSGLATIGGHTVNHYNLAHLTAKEALDEMERGRKRIEQQLGRPVQHFCYPFGVAQHREFTLAKELGFKTCTTCQSVCLTKGHRRYPERFPRIMVEETTSACSLAI